MFEELRNNDFQKNLPLGPIGSESEFYAFWSKYLSGEKNLTVKAFKGGICSDRFAWVFLSGYQSAIQHTFSEMSSDHWASFAVSEDRRGTLPGLDWSKTEKGILLNGYKTWVAAVDQMNTIIVKAGRGDRAVYLAVDRDHSNLTLTRKEQGFLPEMSEGVAHFQDAVVSEKDLLSDKNVKQFGKIEILYIYLAFCGLVASKSKDTTVVDNSWAIAEEISALVHSEDFFALKEVDVKVQQLRDEAGGNMLGVSGWDADQKLIAMYSKGIQSRGD
tara:strand:- start:3361 stop:4179 length:819 start_codon:yes stop_codon:yes gene_type:complete